MYWLSASFLLRFDGVPGRSGKGQKEGQEDQGEVIKDLPVGGVQDGSGGPLQGI